MRPFLVLDRLAEAAVVGLLVDLGAADFLPDPDHEDVGLLAAAHLGDDLVYDAVFDEGKEAGGFSSGLGLGPGTGWLRRPGKNPGREPGRPPGEMLGFLARGPHGPAESRGTRSGKGRHGRGGENGRGTGRRNRRLLWRLMGILAAFWLVMGVVFQPQVLQEDGGFLVRERLARSRGGAGT